MINTPANLLKFLNAARNLAKQGLKEKDILAFAKQEFGEVTDLVRLQINKIFKTKNQPSVGIKTKDPVFDNTVETIPFDDTGTPFNPRDPQKVYGKPREGIKTLDEAEMDIKSIDDATNELNDAVTEADAFSESIGFPAATKKIKNEPLDPDDVLPNYNETPGEFARRNTSGSKENLLEQMKAAYPQRYNNLTGNETAAELKGIMEKANKTDVPFTEADKIETDFAEIENMLSKGNLDDLFIDGKLNKNAVLKTVEDLEIEKIAKNKNRQMTPEELEDFELDIGGDNLEAYDFDGTVGDGARILKEQKKYMDDMYSEYKAEGGSKRLGGPKDPMADAIDNASPGYTGDLKYDAQLVADDLAEKMYGVEYDDLTQAQQMELYDKAYTALSKNQQTLKGIKNTGKIDISDGKIAEEATKFFKENNPEGYKKLEESLLLSNAKRDKNRKDNSKGGRIKMAKGGLPNILGF